VKFLAFCYLKFNFLDSSIDNTIFFFPVCNFVTIRIGLFLMFNYVFTFQIICLSATTNKLSNIQKQAEEYAALIMEELDPDDTGFIMVIITYKIIL